MYYYTQIKTKENKFLPKFLQKLKLEEVNILGLFLDYKLTPIRNAEHQSDSTEMLYVPDNNRSRLRQDRKSRVPIK